MNIILKPPFSAKGRRVYDSYGVIVVKFPKGFNGLAEDYCNLINQRHEGANKKKGKK